VRPQTADPSPALSGTAPGENGVSVAARTRRQHSRRVSITITNIVGGDDLPAATPTIHAGVAGASGDSSRPTAIDACADVNMTCDDVDNALSQVFAPPACAEIHLGISSVGSSKVTTSSTPSNSPAPEPCDEPEAETVFVVLKGKNNKAARGKKTTEAKSKGNGVSRKRKATGGVARRGNASGDGSKRLRTKSGQLRCLFAQGCMKQAQPDGKGNKKFCIAHGGGTRCQSKGCSKSTQGGTLFCKEHGGGKRCQSKGCPKSAQGRTMFCVEHGGGKRCQSKGCPNSAVDRTPFCIAHGGGTKCAEETCTKKSQGPSFHYMCKRHCTLYKKGAALRFKAGQHPDEVRGSSARGSAKATESGANDVGTTLQLDTSERRMTRSRRNRGIKVQVIETNNTASPRRLDRGYESGGSGSSWNQSDSESSDDDEGPEVEDGAGDDGVNEAQGSAGDAEGAQQQPEIPSLLETEAIYDGAPAYLASLLDINTATGADGDDDNFALSGLLGDDECV
jgi:hypothetical protein